MVISCNVLLVDDEPVNLLALEAVLDDVECKLTTCSSGEQALRELLRNSFALILLDLQMPTLNGIEVARMIRAREATKNTPIIFITAFDASAKEIDDAYDVGAVDFLTKPVNPQVLRAKVRFFVELCLKTAKLNDATRQLHEAELRASRGRTRLFLENTPEWAFIELTLEGKISGWGPGARLITGWAEAEVIGSDLAFLFTPEDVAADRPVVERALAIRDGRAPDKRWHLRRDGTRFFADGALIAVYDERGVLQSLAKFFQDATARVSTEMERDRLFKEAQAANARLKDVFDQAPAFLCTLRGPNHVFEMANDRYYQLIGKYTDITGRTVLEVLPEVETQGFVRLLDEVYQSGKSFVGNGVEVSLIQQDGSTKQSIIDFVYVALKDGDGRVSGVMVHGVDITEKRELEREARTTDERYRKLIASIDEGFCLIEVMCDAQGRPNNYRFLEVNNEFSAQTGLGDDCVGKTVRELVPELDPIWIERYGSVALTGKPIRFTDEAVAMQRWFDVYATRLGNEDSRTVALLFRDITEPRLADAELRRLAAELSDASRRKSEFLAVLAHELRNPLAPIRTGIELMGMETLSASGQRVRAMMERQLSHMVHLIDDLMDIARITSGKMELNLGPVLVRDVLATAVEATSPALNAAQHTLSVDWPEDGLVIVGDQVRLSQIVGNLLTNAVKYTPNKGRIALTAARVKDVVVIAVTDNGVGIPADALPLVFDMFSQVSSNLGRAQGGLGIGLAIVKQLIELHGGRIAVTSEGVGQGSCFTVTLPAVVTAQPGSDSSLVKLPPGADSAAHRLRVLVADDNVDAASSMASLLELRGHTVQLVHDGLSAVRLASEFHPDVMFLDIGMPGMTGLEVARAIRVRRELADVKLVAVTGWGSQDDLARARDAGFDHHLTKPAYFEDIDTLLMAFSSIGRRQ